MRNPFCVHEYVLYDATYEKGNRVFEQDIFTLKFVCSKCKKTKFITSNSIHNKLRKIAEEHKIKKSLDIPIPVESRLIFKRYTGDDNPIVLTGTAVTEYLSMSRRKGLWISHIEQIDNTCIYAKSNTTLSEHTVEQSEASNG